MKKIMKTQHTLVEPLREYEAGWVALNADNEVVIHEKSFVKLANRLQKLNGEEQEKLRVSPASKDFSNFIG